MTWLPIPKVNVFPAYAGMSRLSHNLTARASRFPRLRGDEPEGTP